MNLKDIQPGQCFHYIFGLSCERHAMIVEAGAKALAELIEKGKKEGNIPTKKQCLEALLSPTFTEEERLLLMHTYSPLIHGLATLDVSQLQVAVIGQNRHQVGEDRIIN